MKRILCCLTALALLCLFTNRLPARAAAPARVMGIDVSRFQETIDWEKAAADGVRFAIIRCCKMIHETGYTEYDSKFEENYDGARAAGIAVGCYMNTDAASYEEFGSDVAFLLSHIRGRAFEFPVFLDLESPTRQGLLSPDSFMPMVLSALSLIRGAGYLCGVYSANHFFTGCLDREMLSQNGYVIWEANYFGTAGLPAPDNHDLSAGAEIWQYSGNGTCAGIRPAVDRDICYTERFFVPRFTLRDALLPQGELRPGEGFSLSGALESNVTLAEVTAEIYARGGASPLESLAAAASGLRFEFSALGALSDTIARLPAGDYVLKISGKTASRGDFSVPDSAFSILPPPTTTAVRTTTVPPTTTAQTTTAETTTAQQTTVSQTATATPSQTASAASAVTRETTTVSKSPRPERPDTEGQSGPRLVLEMSLSRLNANRVAETLDALVRAGESLSLDRTPLYRIFSRAKTAVSQFRLTAWLLTSF